MPYNAWVLMMDPLNYASVDLSIDVFDDGLATLVLNKPFHNYMLLNFSCFLTFFKQYEFLMPSNAWVLMMDPLNYASVDLSIEGFHGALATLGLNKPIKDDMLLNFSCFLPFFTQYEFLMLYNTWVLMVDPLNYASVNLSIEGFDGALATQGLNRPIKNYMWWKIAKHFFRHI